MVKKRGKGKKRSTGMKDLPKGMSVLTRKGGTTKQIEREFKSAHNKMLYLKDGDEATIAFMTSPDGFVRYEEHNLPPTRGATRGFTIPCAGAKKCLVHKKYPDNEVRKCALVPVWHYDSKAPLLFRASGSVMSELLRRFERAPKKFLGRQWTIIREGSDLQTTYLFELEDEQVKPKIKTKKPLDGEEELNRQLMYNINAAGLTGKDDEEEDEDEEDIDEEDEEDEDEDDELDDDEDNDDEEDEDEDSDDDDDEEDEEDDEDEEIDEEELEDLLPPKKKKKGKSKAGSKKKKRSNR